MEENDPSSDAEREPGTDGFAGLPPELVEDLRVLRAAARRLSDRAGRAAGPDGLDGRQADAVATELAAVGSLLSVARVRLLPVMEADGWWATTGARSFPVWVAGAHGLPVAAARAQVRLARTLRDHLPVTAAAAAAGELTAEQVQVLAAHAPTSDQRRTVLADPGHECNEQFLVDRARHLTVDETRVLARQWAAYADPDADDRGYVESCEREHLEIARLGAMFHLAGQLTLEHGHLLRTALAAVTPVPAPDDQRSGSQRRAQALADLARITLDHGLVGVGKAVRPRITVLVDHPTMTAIADAAAARTASPAEPAPETPRTPPMVTRALLAGHAVAGGPQLEDRTPVPRALLEKLACDSELHRIIFGAESEVLDVGRAERTFTRSRRAAIVARDKHCRYPGCTAPPALSECHHVRQWARDHGPTSVENGILLCWYHHARVHRRGIGIVRRGSRWRFTHADGRPIDPDDDADLGPPLAATG